MSGQGDLSFSSAYRYEKVAIKGNTTFSVSNFGVQDLTIAHNLGYVPYFKLFYTYGDGKYFELFTGPNSYGIDGNTGQIDNAYADSTNLYVEVSEQSGAATVAGTIYYRIYAEQIV